MTLDFTPENVPVPVGHYIGGTLVTPAGEREIDVNRPSDGKFFASIPDASADTVDHAVSGALRAAKESGWSTCAPRERTRALYRWAELIEQDVVLLQLESACSTRPVTLAKSGDVASAAETIRFFAELADKEGGGSFCYLSLQTRLQCSGALWCDWCDNALEFSLIYGCLEMWSGAGYR